jgi:peptide/nickel transport system permease protein
MADVMTCNLKNNSADLSLKTGTIMILILILFLAAGSLISPYQPGLQDLSQALRPPSREHPLGTDFYGRDLLTRLIYGGRITLGISLTATILAITIGTTIGLFCGFIGGLFDLIWMRFIDILLGFPRIFIILLIIGLGYSSLSLVVLVMALFSWMEIARIVRANVWVVKEQLYIKSARALGLPRRRIIFRHILPNVSGPIIVSAVLLISSLILLESGLSFLGLGAQPPTASWGTILNEGRIDPLGTWWISLFSGILIIVSVIGFNLIGDGIQNMLNQAQSGERDDT